MSHLDGNVMAGPLSELFRFDPTTTTARCAGCGDTSTIAQAMVYVKRKAYIARCHVCDTVLMTLIEAADGPFVDLSGIASIKVAG